MGGMDLEWKQRKGRVSPEGPVLGRVGSGAQLELPMAGVTCYGDDQWSSQ